MQSVVSQISAARESLRDGVGRYRALLASPQSRTLIGASALSDLGDWMNIIAMSVLAYRFGDGVLAVGVLLALRKIPGLLLQVPAGSLIDRVQGPRLLITSQLLMAVIASSFIFLIPFPNLWLLYGLVIALELVNVVTFPAFRSAVARWTQAEQRGSANALLSLEDGLAFLIGPVIGGLILAGSSAAVLFLINGLTYVVIAVAVARVWSWRVDVGVTPETEIDSDPEPADTSVDGNLTLPGADPDGYRMLLRRGDILGFGFTTILGTMIMQGALAIFIIRAIDLGFGEEGIGSFYAALAAGSIIGGLFAGFGTYMTRSVLVVVAAMEALNAFGFGLFAIAPQPYLVLIILTLVGISSETAETPAITYFQNTLPEAVYGRFYSLFLTAINLGGLVAVLLVPWLGLRIGAANALLALAITGTVVALLYGLVIRVWIRRHATPVVERALPLAAPQHQ